MSTAISTCSEVDTGQLVPVQSKPARRRFHRLAEVRHQEGVTLGTMARRLGLSPAEARRQEQDGDLPLSTLYAWQEALDVPATEFLVEDDAPLSTPVMKRAQLVRMMKTIMSIMERSKQSSVRRLAEFLARQLVETMPELKGVTAWPAVGKRRTTSELGQAAFRRFTSELANELDHGAA